MSWIARHRRLLECWQIRLMKALAIAGWLMLVADIRDGKPENALLFGMCAICLGELSKWRRV